MLCFIHIHLITRRFSVHTRSLDLQALHKLSSVRPDLTIHALNYTVTASSIQPAPIKWAVASCPSFLAIYTSCTSLAIAVYEACFFESIHVAAQANINVGECGEIGLCGFREGGLLRFQIG